MISAIALSLVLQTAQPATWNEVLAQIDKTFHDLERYADVWEFTNPKQPTSGLRYTRLIDKKRSSLRISYFDPVQDKAGDLLLVTGANGKEEYGILFPSKVYYAVPDQGALFKEDNGTGMERGNFFLGAVNFGFAIVCNPAPVLKSFQAKNTESGPSRIATAEAVNPATGNRVTIRLTIMKRYWIPTDIAVELHRPNGEDETMRFHAQTIVIDGKIPKGAFTFDRALVKGFAKKTKSEIQAALARMGK